MVKTSQKKQSQKKSDKRKIFLIIGGLLVLGLAVFAAVKIYEKNRALEEKKSLLDRSFVAVKDVYNKFYSQAPDPKQKDTPARGRCSSAGKYSTLYTCGPEAQLTLTNLEESEYRNLNNSALNSYEQSEYFYKFGSTQPRPSRLDPGLVSMAGTSLKGSDMGCYYISNYVPEKKAATFSWGCKLDINDQYYPTDY